MNEKQSSILCVDDDTDFLDMYRRVFESRGYRVICCSNTQDALEKVIEEKPALVVTDLMMSALDSGFSFARTVREDARFVNIPVIIVTAIGGQRGFDFTPRGDEDLQAMCADAFFDKPVDPTILVAKVEELLKENRQEDSQ
jgi:two-component system cell cycle response regulator DivK